MRRVVTAAAIVALLAAGACAVAPDRSGLARRLEATLDDFRGRYGFPGATAAIALPDGTVVTAASGIADVENGRAMTPATPMLAASIGKTFVAATVLALETEGLLSRKDRLSTHLGDRPWFEALPNARTITIGQLLHHSSGLPDHVQLPEFQRAWARLATPDSGFDPEDLLRLVAGQDPLFEAGTAWAYSDTGFVLLGQVIEKVTGQPWHAAVRARFLDPLGLTGTVASDRPALPGLAIGYVAKGNPFGLPERSSDADGQLLWNPAVESAGGGYTSTSHDLARWGHRLFGGTAMPGPYLDRLLDGVPVDPGAPATLYGAGVAIYADTPRGPVYGHGGWIPAYVSSLRHYADHGATIAFQINTDVGVDDDAGDLPPSLDAALADLAIEAVR